MRMKQLPEISLSTNLHRECHLKIWWQNMQSVLQLSGWSHPLVLLTLFQPSCLTPVPLTGSNHYNKVFSEFSGLVPRAFRRAVVIFILTGTLIDHPSNPNFWGKFKLKYRHIPFIWMTCQKILIINSIQSKNTLLTFETVNCLKNKTVF